MIRSHLRFLAERYEQLDVRYDPEQRTLWCLKRPRTRPCFNPDLLSEIRRFQEAVQATCAEHDERSTPVRFLVWGSRIRDTYNLGGDLQLCDTAGGTVTAVTVDLPSDRTLTREGRRID